MRQSILSALAVFGSTAFAQSKIQQTCKGDLCFSVNVPDSTTGTSGVVYYQVSGPSSNSWIGMGTGSSMSGSNMFIVYAAGNGNVTLSPRKSSGHSMPSPSDSIQATLLGGSGVVGGKMVANIRCANCPAAQSSWIYAAASGGALNSASTSAQITQHGSRGQFTLDSAQAKGGNSANPFADPAGTTGTSAGGNTGGGTSGGSSSSGTPNGPACVSRGSSGASSPTPASAGSGAGATASATSAGGPFGGFPWGPRSSPTGSPPFFYKRQNAYPCADNGSGSTASAQADQELFMKRMQMKLIAHGVLAALAFTVLFPIGAIVLRLFSFPGLVWFHAIWQIITWLLFIIAFALGVTLIKDTGLSFSHHHAIIGIFIFILLLMQPFLGYMHHAAYKRFHKRTFWSHGHLAVGRIIIPVGIINGGLGLRWASNTTYGPIVYGVVAGIFGTAWLAAAFWGEKKRSRSHPPKYDEGSRGMSGPNSPREYYTTGNGHHQ